MGDFQQLDGMRQSLPLKFADSYTVERATFNAIEHVPLKTQHNDSKIFSLARPHYTLDIDEILIKNSLKLMVPQHAYSFNITKFH